MDYVFRRLALDYLDFDTRSALGIYTADERQRYLDTGSHQPISGGTTAAELIEEQKDQLPIVESGEAASSVVESERGTSEGIETTSAEESVEATAKPAPSGAHTSAELLEEITGGAIDSPLCMTCGTKMRPAGSCHVCEGCGSTSGCS
jgi:ribonucleoside-diphosphate reductase alpha chain